uniref:Uncharacterized protein n=1 Tax=Paracidobacterium acidisoli TaxID=2303751 RepID=A0A372IRL3_9BACT
MRKRLSSSPATPHASAMLANGLGAICRVFAGPKTVTGWSMLVPKASCVPLNCMNFCPAHETVKNGMRKQRIDARKPTADIFE